MQSTSVSVILQKPQKSYKKLFLSIITVATLLGLCVIFFNDYQYCKHGGMLGVFDDTIACNTGNIVGTIVSVYLSNAILLLFLGLMVVPLSIFALVLAIVIFRHTNGVRVPFYINIAKYFFYLFLGIGIYRPFHLTRDN